MPKSPPMTLYCFAHAGAGVSSFHRWGDLAGPGLRVVPLMLPGRDKRRREPRLTGRDELLAELLGHITERDPGDGPFALYGHSLGGLVAHTLARALADTASTPPAFVAVGASPPPDAPPLLLHAADAADADLVEALSVAGLLPPGGIGAPGGVWYRAVLPVLRDDLRLAEALRRAAVAPATGGPLTVPLLAVAGSADRLAPAEVLAGWRRWTTDRFVQRTVPGDHFFAGGRELPRLMARACRVARRAGAQATVRT